MATVVHGIDGVKSKAGEDLGSSAWVEVTQERVNLFADATGDHQWIHVDVERAKTGPFKGPIAHGYLTLSLLIPLWSELFQIEGIGMALNYGLDKVRFPAPVPAGSRVRLTARIADVVDVAGGGVQVHVDAVIECDAVEKPVCAAQVVYRYYP